MFKKGRNSANQIAYLNGLAILLVTAKNPSLSEGLETPPNKEKHQIAANVGLSSLGYAAVLAAMGVGVGVGVYFDNTIAGSFAAHVLGAIVVALISEYRRKQK